MLENHVTRPHHFFVPMIIAIVGGIFVKIGDGWEVVGYVNYGISAISTVWLFYSTAKSAEIEKIKEAHYHYAEIAKLDVAKTTTKVAIDKTALEGNYFSRSYAELRIAPAKLKLFALEALDGKKLTIREWTPIKDGKLFSDGEWRRLIAFMKAPVKDRPQVKFIVQTNPEDERQGFELTPAGRAWLENVAESVSLTAETAAVV